MFAASWIPISTSGGLCVWLITQYKFRIQQTFSYTETENGAEMHAADICVYMCVVSFTIAQYALWNIKPGLCKLDYSLYFKPMKNI